MLQLPILRLMGAACLVIALPSGVSAQTSYRVALGAAFGVANPSEEGLDTTLGIGPVPRLQPRELVTRPDVRLDGPGGSREVEFKADSFVWTAGSCGLGVLTDRARAPLP
jgi:hypothetical protein